MYWNNNATRIRRELLVRLVGLMDKGTLEDEVDRIPWDMTPPGEDSVRCCPHHDRAILRLRLMARMGLRIEDLDDENQYRPLSWFARKALERTTPDTPVLTVIDEACHACVQNRIFVTNACQGCMARPCMVNCPKKAISMVNGRAVIDDKQCVNCGICIKACSYGAILQIPVPCEEACPVGAISKGDDGKERIDFDACVSCGACMRSCPFGAVTDRSQIIDVVKALKVPRTAPEWRPVVLMVAPAVMAQFRAEPATVLEACRKLGFHEVWEVATGAVETARQEAQELEETIQHKGPALATSCCPAWVETARKHLGWTSHGESDPAPESAPPAGSAVPATAKDAHSTPTPAVLLSSTPSPMTLTSRIAAGAMARTSLPAPVRVFAGPCVAKKVEALRTGEVDWVISSEELGAFLMARGVELSDCQEAPYPADRENPGRHARGFAASGGVAQAVLAELKTIPPMKVNVRKVDGLTKAVLKDLAKNGPGSGSAFGSDSTAQGPCHLLEGMACQGGCIQGPSILVNPKIAANQLKKG